MNQQIIEDQVAQFVKNGKSQVAFRDTETYTSEKIIENALNDQKHPSQPAKTTEVKGVIVRYAYIPTLSKTLIAFCHNGINRSGYFGDGEIVELQQKEKLKDIEIHHLIREENKKYYISIPYDLKESLKKAISSASFDGDTKEWYVGSRSGKKLSLWISEHESEIIKARKAKADKKERLSKLARLDVSGTYNIKDELQENFGAVFGELGGEKSWFVEPDLYEQCIEYVLKRTQELKVIEQTIGESDNLEQIAEIMDNIIDDFKTCNENKKHRPLGYSARYTGKNPNITELIDKARGHLKSHPKMLPEKINYSLKSMAGDRFKNDDIYSTLFYYVFAVLRNNLNKGLAFTDENDPKFAIWLDQNVILDLIAADILEYIKLDAEIEVDFGY